jgi:hypothetical protein
MELMGHPPEPDDWYVPHDEESGEWPKQVAVGGFTLLQTAGEAAINVEDTLGVVIGTPPVGSNDALRLSDLATVAGLPRGASGTMRGGATSPFPGDPSWKGPVGLAAEYTRFTVFCEVGIGAFGTTVVQFSNAENPDEGQTIEVTLGLSDRYAETVGSLTMEIGGLLYIRIKENGGHESLSFVCY